MKAIKQIGDELLEENQNQTEVIFVPDENIGTVVNCFGSVRISEEEEFSRRRKNITDTPKKNLYSTPKKINGTPVKHTVTRSGRKVVNKFANLDVSLLVEKENNESEEETGYESSYKEEQFQEYIKPSALYDDDNELGKQLFGFQTPRRKDKLLQKTSLNINQHTKGPATPQSKNEPNITPKTPYATRTKIKKRIVEEASRQTLDKMLEESESDYFPTSESSDSDDSDSDAEMAPSSQIKSDNVTIATPSRRTRGEMNQNFMFTTDDYFERQNTRSVTSNHTLNKLKTPKFKQDQLAALLKAINPSHQKAIIDLEQSNQSMYKRWLYSMSEGYNILVYGVGSKKNLLETFRTEFLQNCLSVVINGYFPGVSVKEVLECICYNALGITNLPTHYHEIVEAIGAKQESPFVNRVFVIIHNLDGEVFRCEKTQEVLAHLASLPKIHFITSVDQINCPLLWDQSKLSKMNFVWEDATTFLPYTEETSFESSLMVQRSGIIALSALKNVYQSLTRNTRKVFIKLLNHQLGYVGKQYPGMLFSDLYRTCRDSFIVSSDLALRTQLTEFIDHQIVKWKKDTDHLIIPIDNALLKQFQNEINEEE